jgi:membrane protease subunit HflC
MEAEMLIETNQRAHRDYGIEVAFLGIGKLGLPRDITEKVYERMRAEREEVAERYRSEGEGEAIIIKAKAESESDQVLAAARAEATRIRGRGDAEAARYYSAFEEDPGLASFLKKLEIMELSLKTNATVILSSETEPFDLLLGASNPSPGGSAP